MGSVKKKKGRRRKKNNKAQDKLGLFVITMVVLMLASMVAFGSFSLREKNQKYKQQELELKMQLKEEELEADEIKELEAYIETNAYIEDIAKEKLGLIYPNEILFKPQQ